MQVIFGTTFGTRELFSYKHHNREAINHITSRLLYILTFLFPAKHTICCKNICTYQKNTVPLQRF